MDQQNARAYALLSPALVSLALFLVAPIIFVIIYSFWLRTAEGLDVPAFQFGKHGLEAGAGCGWVGHGRTPLAVFLAWIAPFRPQ